MRDHWEAWSRLIGSIGPYYRTQLFAVVKRRKITSPGLPDDLWIRAAEPDIDDRRRRAHAFASVVANPDHRAEQACVDDSLTRQRNHSLPQRGFQQSSRPVFLVHASGTTGPGRQNTGRPRSGPRPREALGARPSRNQRLHLLLVTRRARVSCGVCSEPEIGCVRRTAVRTRSEHLPNIWGIRGFRRIHICPGNRTFCETLPDARAPSHGGNPGSNPGSGTPEAPYPRGFSRF